MPFSDGEKLKKILPLPLVRQPENETTLMSTPPPQQKILAISYTPMQGRSQEFTKGEKNQVVWATKVPGGVQGQNMETLENTNGAVTKIDLR